MWSEIWREVVGKMEVQEQLVSKIRKRQLRFCNIIRHRNQTYVLVKTIDIVEEINKKNIKKNRDHDNFFFC